MGFFIENIDKRFSDRLPLGFRIGQPLQGSIKPITCVDALYIEAHVLVGVEHLLKLVLSQQPIVDKYAVQVSPYGLVYERCCDRGIHPTRKGHHDFVVAQLVSQGIHSTLNELVGRPLLLTTTDMHHKIAQKRLAFHGMGNFGVELNAVAILSFKLESGDRHRCCAGNDLKSVRYGGNGVAMGHPYLCIEGNFLEQLTVMVDRSEASPSVLAYLRREN